jgi:hypothetical protein
MHAAAHVIFDCRFVIYIVNAKVNIMAGHLEVDKVVQFELYRNLWSFLDKQPIKEMKPFDRYKEGELTFQRLTDRNEEGDAHVLSVYPWDFEIDGEAQEGAIAEIHLSSELTVNKVYMVL